MAATNQRIQLINRHMKLYYFLITTLIFSFLASAETKKPNVVLIFADDLGYGDLGCYGATKVKTPNIDQLSLDGRRFTDAHSASSVCTPSRFALMTGVYPHRKKIYRPVFDQTGLIIDTKSATVASVLKEQGYATACIGKWHLGFGDKKPDWNGELKPGPLEVGFDYYYGVPVVNSHPPFVYVENHRVVGLVEEDPIVYGKKAKTQEMPEKINVEKMGGGDAAHALYDDYQVGKHLTEKSLTWIKDNKENPFFLFLSTTNIHHPFTPAPEFQGTSECGAYGDYIHELDWIVGQVVKTLEEEGLSENTLIIFTSDNGGMINETAQEAWKMGHEQNGDLFGFKFDAWEGGHRVPFIAKWPAKIPPNSVSDQIVSNVDFTATFASLSGGAIPKTEAIDSVDITEALVGTPSVPVRQELVIAAGKPSHLSLRKGKWMYIPAKGGGGFRSPKKGAHNFGGSAAAHFAKRVNSDMEKGAYKKDAAEAQLYDLEVDPNQMVNLYNSKPDVVAEMVQALETYKK